MVGRLVPAVHWWHEESPVAAAGHLFASCWKRGCIVTGGWHRWVLPVGEPITWLMAGFKSLVWKIYFFPKLWEDLFLKKGKKIVNSWRK